MKQSWIEAKAKQFSNRPVQVSCRRGDNWFVVQGFISYASERGLGIRLESGATYPVPERIVQSIYPA